MNIKHDNIIHWKFKMQYKNIKTMKSEAFSNLSLSIYFQNAGEKYKLKRFVGTELKNYHPVYFSKI
jgi:hypothetical protein